MKKIGVFEYNPRCIMSIGLMFDNMIINLFRNNALNQHMEVAPIPYQIYSK